ncbi:MAG: type II toxin-antitoxin system ParD family antitoxin [Alphaproteobacteria bacterium]|nr:type II toxin-antitoxin system ParD family antitoxin [Alphaproteobacteria bacterium]
MNISLTPQLEKFVRAQVAGGHYNNASEVLRDALRLLVQNQEERRAKIARLRELGEAGEREIAAGQGIVLRTAKDVEKFFRSLP